MSELVKALRDAYEETDTVYFHLRTIIKDAADTIDRLTAENARLDAELGRCTSGNGTYISLESHNRILAKQTAELLQKTQQLTETNKALESDNYNAEMNLSRLTERLAAAVEVVRCCDCKYRNVPSKDSEGCIQFLYCYHPTQEKGDLPLLVDFTDYCSRGERGEESE